MKINGNTKVSKVIKENKEAIDLIASLNPYFSKLRNPVFRWFFSPQITLEDYAKKGNYDAQLMLDALWKLGFKVDQNTKVDIDPKEQLLFAAKTGFIEGKKVRSIDLNSKLDNTEDSLFEVLKKELDNLQLSEVLDAQLDLNPIFLTKLFEKMGYLSLSVPDKGIYHNYFKLDIPKFQGGNENLFHRTVEFKERISM